MNVLWQDARLALRGYARRPLFTIIVVAILGIGIGANSIIFSIVNAVLLRPLEYPQASRLVSVFQMNRDTHQRTGVSPPNYFDLEEHGDAVTGLAAYWSPSLNISGAGGDPEHVLAATCSHNLFDVLRVRPQRGRSLIADDDVPGARRVAVISHGLWQRRFGRDPGAIGRELVLDGTPTLIVGVMPAGFDFPAAGTDVWVPLRLSRTQPPTSAIPLDTYRQYRILSLVGRLKDDVTLAQAGAVLDGVARELERQFPDANHHTAVSIEPLHETVVGQVRPALIILLAAVASLLLIACANVGSLLLVRAAGRTREVTIRMALGANRSRLVRQMFTESLVLAFAGGALGLLISVWGLDLLLRVVPAGIPRLDHVGMDATVVGFALLVSVAAGLMFGIAPAMQVRRGRLQDALLASGRSTVTGAHQRMRQALVIGEVALSLTLLIVAVLLIQSFVRVQGVDAGFRPSPVLTIDRIDLPRARSSADASAVFFDALLAKLRDIPGIESASLTLGLPLDARARFFVDDSPFSIAGEARAPAAQRPNAPLHVVSPAYLATIGVPLLQGREFTDRDRAESPAVVIINEAMARRFWPGRSPLGQRITHDLSIVPDQPSTREIVGVVGNVRHFSLEQPPEPQMFVPHAQMPWPSMAVVIRTPLDAARLSAAVRQAVWGLDRTIPVPVVRPMNDVLSDAVGQPRFRAWLLGLFASIAFLLAMVGLYGTMAYAAQQRTREIGLRIALGASPRQVTTMLVGNGLTLALIGAALGLAGSLAVTRALSTMLFGVGATDPVTFVGVPTVLLAVAAMACYLPARHARGLDPVRAINSEG